MSDVNMMSYSDAVDILSGYATAIKTNVSKAYATMARNGVKNQAKLQYDSKTETMKGISFVYNNGEIDVSGTATAQSYTFPANSVGGGFDLEPGRKYVLTGMPTGVTGVSLLMRYNDGSNHVIATDTGSGAAFDFTQEMHDASNGYNLMINVASGTEIAQGGITVRPMIRYAEDLDVTFEKHVPTNKEIAEILANSEKVIKLWENPDSASPAGFEEQDITFASDDYDMGILLARNVFNFSLTVCAVFLKGYNGFTQITYIDPDTLKVKHSERTYSYVNDLKYHVDAALEGTQDEDYESNIFIHVPMVVYGVKFGNTNTDGGRRYGLIAASSASGTYSQKIDQLYSAYNALTFEEKLRAVIVQNDRYIYQVTDTVGASFTKLTSFENGGSTTDENVIITMQQSGSSVWKFQVGAGTSTNASNTSNDLVFKLYLR